MGSLRSLLSRLERPDSPDARALPDSTELLEAIRSNLILLLNSRHGGARTVPDFGTSEFSDVSRGYKSMRRMQDDIRRSIERYEPRLAAVKVQHVKREDDPFTMHFEITGKVVHEGRRVPVVFRSVVEPNGEVTIKRG